MGGGNLKHLIKLFVAVQLLVALLAAGPVLSWTHGASDGSTVVRDQKNIVADYSATCNGVANDTSAFLAFKTAYQGGPPVTLTIPPGSNCRFIGTAGAGLLPFAGIPDLIVSGYGATFTNASGGTQPVLFGANGQVQNNRNSVRLQTVSAGNYCVTMITQPLQTITNVQNSFAMPASVTASISSSILAISATLSGTIATGQYIGAIGGTYIVGSNVDATHWNLTPVGSSPTTLSSRRFDAAPAAFTATASGTTLDVTSMPAGAGTIAIGQRLYDLTGATPEGLTITGLGTGNGGVGTYTYDIPTTLSSRTFVTNGVPRLTVASTAGYDDGTNPAAATVFVQGVTGTSQVDSYTNGLRWAIKVDSTHLDLFQSDWQLGSVYTSGGTVGGDRTAAFPVGRSVVITGYPLQQYWFAPYGYPSNTHWFEYQTVQSVDSSTHQVCFTAPLAYTYKSTWPQYNTGSNSEVDPGGPATMYILPANWDLNHEYKGLTISNPSFQLSSNGKTVKWTDATTADGTCMIPTQNVDYTWLRVTGVNCDIEIDKLITRYTIRDSSLRKLGFQSSSLDVFTTSNTTYDKAILGSPKSMVGSGLTINGNGQAGAASLTIGTGAYGATTGPVSCINCVVANGIVQQSALHVVNSCWSFGGTGIITIPNNCSNLTNELQIRWAVPGGNFFIGNTSTSISNYALGQVLDVTQDLTNTYVATSFTSGFPVSPGGLGITRIFAHPAPSLTMTGSSGHALVTGLANCDANLPMFSCYKQTYTGSATGTTAAEIPALWGKFSSMLMDVTTPYGGAGALSWRLSASNNWLFFRESDAATRSFGSVYGGGPSVDMKTSGLRTMTQTTVTNGKPLDVLNPPNESIWAGRGNAGPSFSANTPSHSPVVTVTILTDQGVVYP